MPPKRRAPTRRTTTSQRERSAELGSPPPQPRNMAILLTLLPELQKSIAECPTTHRDMKAMCLVCKELRDLIMPFLYRRVSINHVQLTGSSKRIFDRKHAGLPIIRILIVDFGPTFPHREEKELAALCELLTGIPKNTLDLKTHRPPARDVGYLCRIRQARLRNYQYRRTDGPALPDVIPIANELKHVTTLQIWLKDREDCTVAGKLLQRARHTQNIAIAFNSVALDKRLGTPPEAAVAALDTLFAQCRKNKPGLQLLAVRLEGLDLGIAGAILPTLTDLRGLRRLQIERCQAFDKLLEALTQTQLPLNSLVVTSRFYAGDLQVLKTFLDSPTGPHVLEKLRLTAGLGHVSIDCGIIESLITLGPARKVLELHDIKHSSALFDGGQYDDMKVLSLFTALSNLEQLSIQVPKIERPFYRCHVLDRVTACLKNLSNLRTLKLCCTPEFYRREDEFCDYEMHSEYLVNLRFDEMSTHAADRVFSSLAKTCPHLIAFDVQANDDGISDQRPFLRAKQIDVHGCMKYVGVRSNFSMIRHAEPASDVLKDEEFLMI